MSGSIPGYPTPAQGPGINAPRADVDADGPHGLTPDPDDMPVGLPPRHAAVPADPGGTTDVEMDEAVRAYIDEIPTEHRAAFNRLHRVIEQTVPGVRVVWSYKMPTYVAGDRRMHVAVWAHGLSVYGWQHGHDGGFAQRHPELDSGKGTLRIPTSTAADITDDELRALVSGTLNPRLHLRAPDAAATKAS